LATLKEISAELGLSVATVSRALNGFPRPNRVAQRLVTGRSGMVGMIVKIKPDMSADQTFFEILTGLTAALAKHDTDLVLAVDQEQDPVLPYKKLLERDILDGFAAVSRDSVKLLSQLGHRRIALINGELKGAYANDRADGFVQEMTRLGLAPDMLRNEASFESHGYTHALDLLSAESPPTGFICASTLIASGVMNAVRDRGLSVPGDVSVIAHDDALPQTRAINFDPALTVTRAPLRDACAPLANMLVDHLNGRPAKDLNVVLKADLIVRGSTGPAPKEE